MKSWFFKWVNYWKSVKWHYFSFYPKGMYLTSQTKFYYFWKRICLAGFLCVIFNSTQVLWAGFKTVYFSSVYLHLGLVSTSSFCDLLSCLIHSTLQIHSRFPEFNTCININSSNGSINWTSWILLILFELYLHLTVKLRWKTQCI